MESVLNLTVPGGSLAGYQYSAYISCAPADAAFARRLHRALETYDIPKKLMTRNPFGGARMRGRLDPIFRDRAASAASLGANSQKALEASGALIVVCSPDTLASARTHTEIAAFAVTGRDVLTIVPDVAPFIHPANNGAAADYSPPTLHGAVAVDARRGKDGFRVAVLTLIAHLIGAGANDLLADDRPWRRRAWGDDAWSFVREVTRTFGALGTFAAGMAVIALFSKSLGAELRGALELLLGSYRHFVEFALGWADPCIERALEWLNRLAHWNLDPQDHWKDIFVLLLVYFGRDQGAGGWIRRPGGLWFFLLVGLPVAIMVNIGAGCIGPSQQAWAEAVLAPLAGVFAGFGWTLLNPGDVLIALIAAIGIGTYDFAKLLWYVGWLREWHARQRGEQKVKSRREFFLEFWWIPLAVTVIATVIAVAVPQSPIIRDYPIPGLFVVLFMIFALTIHWLVVGVTRVHKVREPDDNWWRAYPRSGPGLLGLWMFAVFVVAFGLPLIF